MWKAYSEAPQEGRDVVVLIGTTLSRGFYNVTMFRGNASGVEGQWFVQGMMSGQSITFQPTTEMLWQYAEDMKDLTFQMNP